jgi:hypothetical protein
MDLNIVQVMVCKEKDRQFYIEMSQDSYKIGSREFKIQSKSEKRLVVKNESTSIQISTIGANNCYATGLIYEKDELVSLFRVVKFHQNGVESANYDVPLVELHKMAIQKLENEIKSK